MSKKQKVAWSYSYTYEFENGEVKSYTRFEEDEQKETVNYYYDDNGLLKKR